MTGRVVLRTAVEEDEPFLRRLFLDCHPEFSRLPPPVGDSILDLQYQAQRSQYRDGCPDGTDQVIELDDRPVGRCWITESPDGLRVVDIAVLTDFRGRGVARAVLGTLQERAGVRQQPVRLSVWADNQLAMRLYTDLGFVTESEHNGYLGLIWSLKT